MTLTTPTSNSYNPGPSFTISSGFGTRNDPINPSNSEYHPGQDYAAPVGTSIPAASNGTVIYSGMNGTGSGTTGTGYGFTVIVQSTGENGQTYYTLYAHMDGTNMPAVGATVTQGQTIGKVGNTGRTTGPHLHFEVLNSSATPTHGAGGAIGFTSSNQSIRVDPNSFTNWNGGAPLKEGHVEISVPDDTPAPSDAADPNTGGVAAESTTTTTLNGQTTSEEIKTFSDTGTESIIAAGSTFTQMAPITDSNATIEASGAVVTIEGNNDSITGNDNKLVIEGDNDDLDVDFSTVDVEPGFSGDSVEGDDDTGENWDGGGGYYYSGDQYGFAGSKATVAKAVGSNIGSIAQYDLDHGNAKGAATAEAALHKVQSTIAADTQNAVLSGAKWDQHVVTWSAADSAGPNGATAAPMTAGEVAAVQQAFAAWGAATGLKFEEVADSAQSDIRVGLADFDTADTGVVGLTRFTENATTGTFQPGVVVQVEAPSDDSLVAGTNGLINTYSGTQATFSQALLHEIGHALGFGSNADPNSVMSYSLGGGNQTLDSTDLAGAAQLYGTNASGTVNQLVQAAATFVADSGAASSQASALSATNSDDLLLAAAKAA